MFRVRKSLRVELEALTIARRTQYLNRPVPPPLEREIADKKSKGPRAAHPLNIYRPVHKLHQSARWKSANIVTGIIGGNAKKLRVVHNEGITDATGQHRDWLYGEDRRWGNYLGCLLAFLCGCMFFYTIHSLRSDTWEVPEPLILEQPAIATKKPSAPSEERPISGSPMLASRD